MAALEERAGAILPESVTSYYASGSADGLSVAEASTAWDSWRLRPRVLRDVSSVSTQVRLLGSTLATPVGVAPSAAHRLAHQEGEAATAAGVAAATSLLVLSTRSTTRLATVAGCGADWWMQVYVLRDRGVSDEIARQAASHGAGALVLTGDTPVVGPKAGVAVPDLPVERLLPVLEERDADEHLVQARDVTLDDIERLSSVSGLPVLVKGVLRADDALDCASAGAAGVVVSNHGGRQLDGAVPTAFALGEVADALAGSGLAVLVDGGIRTGRHVLSALALGADAVLLGRPVLWALAVGGADGVASLLAEMTEQTRLDLALAGCRGVSDSSPHLLWHPHLRGRSV
jgi:4-hydroxymandelate oxidase